MTSFDSGPVFLDSGQFSRVWKVSRCGSVYALKHIKPISNGEHMETAEAMRMRLRDEVCNYWRVRGATNFVQLVDVGLLVGSAVQLLEHCEGGSLASIFEEQEALAALPLRSKLAMLSQLCAALEHLHDRVCALHGDLHPGNVLFADAAHRRLKIGDLERTATFAAVEHDIARVLDGRETPAEDGTWPLGSPLYEPPEAFAARNLAASLQKRHAAVSALGWTLQEVASNVRATAETGGFWIGAEQLARPWREAWSLGMIAIDMLVPPLGPARCTDEVMENAFLLDNHVDQSMKQLNQRIKNGHGILDGLVDQSMSSMGLEDSPAAVELRATLGNLVRFNRCARPTAAETKAAIDACRTALSGDTASPVSPDADVAVDSGLALVAQIQQQAGGEFLSLIGSAREQLQDREVANEGQLPRAKRVAADRVRTLVARYATRGGPGAEALDSALRRGADLMLEAVEQLHAEEEGMGVEATAVAAAAAAPAATGEAPAPGAASGATTGGTVALKPGEAHSDGLQVKKKPKRVVPIETSV